MAKAGEAKSIDFKMIDVHGRDKGKRWRAVVEHGGAIEGLAMTATVCMY